MSGHLPVEGLMDQSVFGKIGSDRKPQPVSIRHGTVG